MTDPRMRRLAVELLADESISSFQRGRAADLLVRNAAPGDVALLSGLLATRQDDDELHGLGFGLLDWLAAHPAPDAASALVAIYEYDPCSLCRERAVERLHEINALPNWLVEECRYDANLNLRTSMNSWRPML